MIGFGTYNQPHGTFSDDTSLTLCLAEGLTKEFSLKGIANNFVKWYHNNYWTASGELFDIGIATKKAINKIVDGKTPELAGGTDASSNGNGSLMRILPLLFYICNKPIAERFQIIKQVSSITHGHIRSVIACFYYLEFAKQILYGVGKSYIYKSLQRTIPTYLKSISVDNSEIELFNRLLKFNVSELREESIESSGYVLHTLEASIWCLMTTDNYKDAALKAVNLGNDTDTTAAVTGGLTGLLYGFNSIPTNWIGQLARIEDIIDLGKRMSDYLSIQK